MKINEILNIIEESQEFKDWKEKNQDVVLAHVFKLYENNTGNFQLGYYDEKRDVMTPVEYQDDKITIGEESQIFKKEDSKVTPLNLETVKIEIPEALKTATEVQKEKYVGQEPIKILMILQTIESKSTYNITFVTQAFKTLNIKIDAADGSVLSDQITSIFNFSKGDGGSK